MDRGKDHDQHGRPDQQAERREIVPASAPENPGNGQRQHDYDFCVFHYTLFSLFCDNFCFNLNEQSKVSLSCLKHSIHDIDYICKN